MPLYEVEHAVALTAEQCDELAAAITQIHSELFTTPRMFVQVRFRDARARTAYIGGVRRAANHIVAHVRSGPSRAPQDWDRLLAELVAAWNRVVPLPRMRRSAADAAAAADAALWSCVIVGGRIGSWEGGFVLPPAGGDVAWLREHWDEFKLKADGGDEIFQDLVADVQGRGLLEGAGKTPRQRLEEALGWGDAA